MREEMLQIAARIRELREIFELSSEQMAEEIGVSIEDYRAFEEDGENIPASALYHIAHHFKVDMTEILTGKPARLNTYAICRRGQGKTVERFSGYHYENLGHRFSGKLMEPFLVTLHPTDKPADLVTHKGQEVNYILEGQIAVIFDGKEHILNPGDLIYFDPTHPHGQKAVGTEKARFLSIILE